MKKSLSLFLVVLFVICSIPSALAYAAIEDDYVFDDNDDGTLAVFMYSGETDHPLVIPASYQGKAITTIVPPAFYNSEIVDVQMPVSMKKICTGAFDSSWITVVRFNEGLETIETRAFNNCSSLTEVSIPSTLSSLGDGAFSNCSGIVKVGVAEGNEYYCSDGSAIYDIDKTVLLLYAVKSSAQEYVLPSTVTTIESYVFYSASSLKTLYLPETLSKIGDYAFYKADKLTDIYFAGSEDEWGDITKGTKNEVLSSVTMHYNEVKPCDVHTWNEGEVKTPATCTQKGVKTFTCTVCGATEDREIAALGHDYVSSVTPPTCTEKGYITNTCSRCQDSYTSDETGPLGHDFGEWTVTTEPTCTQAGEETRYCSRCSATETQPIPAPGHSWDGGVVTKEPTCSEDGEKTFTCTACSATKTEPVKATGKHTAVTDKKVPATFKKSGLTKGSHCSVCGKVITAQKVIPKLGKPSIVKLTKGKNGLTVKWTKVSRIHGYKIQVSKSRKFAKSKTKTFTVKDQKKIKRTIKRYKKGKYYVRIRAYKVIGGKKQFSKWSKAKSIK
ncbi:MAG: leucine-rich repeat domain-containing protein [Eubacterium sp.]|nr:leucine-rich repeat domain-containing protein [Eubacterium sp.]